VRVARAIAAVAGAACGVAAIWYLTGAATFGPNSNHANRSDLPAELWVLVALVAALIGTCVYQLITRGIAGSRRQREPNEHLGDQRSKKTYD